MTVTPGTLLGSPAFLHNGAGHVHALRSLGKGAAEDHVVDESWIHVQSVQRAVDGDRSEVLGPDVAEGSPVRFAHGGANGGDDKGFVDLHVSGGMEG